MEIQVTDAQQALVSLARDWSPEARQDLICPPVGADAQTPDPLQAIADLRRVHPKWSPDFAAAVATQRALATEGRAKGVIPPGPWLATRVGLEQSTRLAVARRRAAHLAAAGVESVVDLTAGLGVDSWACAEAGLSVVAVERDPLTAELCRANVPAARVHTGDALTTDPASVAELELLEPICWLVDPSRRAQALRRDGTRAGPERDPERWSPPWSFVERLRRTQPWVAAKAPGGLDPEPGWSAEWVGVEDYVVECAVYSAPTGVLEHPRQATLLGPRDGDELTYEVTNTPAPSGELRQFIGEPHPVFHRALAELCASHAHRVSKVSTWITADAPDIAGVRWLRVVDSAPLKRMRDLARSLGIDAVAIKSRESVMSVGAVRARLGLPDGNAYAVVLARGLPNAILAEFVPAG